VRRTALSFLKADHWKPARWAVLAIALIHLIGLNAYAWHTNTQLQAQRDRLRDTLVTTFPNVKVVVDAPVQMERELALLRQARGATSPKDLEAMLGALGSTGTIPLPAGGPASLEYANGEMRLGGWTLSPEQANALNQQLGSSGLSAQLDGSTWVLRAKGTR